MGIRPPDPDYDPEKDPEFEAALARYVQNNPDSPQAQQQAALPPLVQPTHLPPVVVPAPVVETAPMPVAPPQPLSGVTSVKEEEDRFLVTQGGATFPVLKDGLKKDTLAHFQGLAHAFEAASPAQGGAGGKATPLLMASGGEVPDAGFGQTSFLPLAPLGTPDAGTGAPVQFTPGGAITPSLFEQLNGAPPAVEQLWAVPQAIGRAVGNAPDVLREVILGPLGNAISKDASVPTNTPSLPAHGVIGPGAGALARETAAPPPPVQQPMAMPSLPGVPSQVGELNKGLAEQRAALDAQVQAQREQDLAVVALQDQHIAKLQALEADYQEQAALTQRRADDLFQATLNAQIDPNRVWAQADMGQRVGAGIALILGGIGAGLGGGPNLALQQINRIIDMDVDAQKFNMEKQQTLLGHYLQQGRDMRAAHQLAKSDLQDLVAAQMLRVSASFGGDRAAAAAQLAAGQLRTEAAGMRSNMYAQDFQRAAQRSQMQAQMEMNRLLMQVVNAPRTPAGGVQMDPRIKQTLPKEWRETMLALPDGSWGFAADPAARAKLEEGFEVASTFASTLKRYRGLLESGHPAIGVWGDRETADVTRRDMIAQLAKLEATGVLQKHDIEYLEPMVPDIRAFFTPDKALQKRLDALQAALTDRVDAKLKTLRGH